MVEFGGDDVVYYIIGVVNFEVVRFDVINSSGIDDGDIFFFVRWVILWVCWIDVRYYF